MKNINFNLDKFFHRIKGRNWPFILLFCILVFINHRHWSDAIWPRHDGVSLFHVFYSFYNELFFNGHLLRWLPYGSFGLHADFFQIQCLSPGSYLAAVLGVIFRVQNALLVFKFSAFLDQLVLLLGTYLFARESFQHKSTIFFVCFGAIGSCVWLQQISWNLRIYYLLPLILYFVIAFFKYQRPRFLWLAGTMASISLIGGCAYWAALYLPLLFLYGLVLFMKRRSACISVFARTRDNLLFFMLFLVTSFIVLYFATHALKHLIVPHMAGRDPMTLLTTREWFLNAGGTVGLHKFCGYFLAWAGLDSPSIFYIGLLPLLFLIYAVMHIRKAPFAAVSIVILFLILLTLGDVVFVASGLYDLFMPIRLFRYIGVIGPIISLFLIFGSGFGLDYFLNILKNRSDFTCCGYMKPLNCCGVILLIIFLFLDVTQMSGEPPSKLWQEFGYFSFLLMGVTLLCLNGPKNSSRFAGWVIIIFFVIELLSYQNLLFASWHNTFPWVKSEATNVHAYAYQPRREIWSTDPRFKAIESVANAVEQRSGVEMFNYHQFDPCGVHMYKNDVYMRDLGELTNRRWQLFKPDQGEGNLLIYMQRPEATAIFNTIGCYVPKLKLVADVVYARNNDEAKKLVESLPDFGKTFVIEAAAPYEMGVNPASNISAAVNVTKFNYNALEAEVDVPAIEGAWLYYADAYHPGWRATINGKKAPIRRANLGFKALYLKQGKQIVKLKYFDGLQEFMSFGLVLIGILFSLFALGCVFRCMWRKNAVFEVGGADQSGWK